MTERSSIIDPLTESLDDLILGGMRLIQPLSGYRFSIDAVLLSHFPDLNGITSVVDLGTGHAIIPHLLAYLQPELQIIGIEIQEAMLNKARRSIEYNRLQNRIRLIQGDIKKIAEVLPGASTQLITCNPPFWKKGSGLLSQNLEQSVARHEIQVELHQIIAAAKYLLVPGGKLCLIHTCTRLQEVYQVLTDEGIAINRLRFIHSRVNENARMFLLEGEIRSIKNWEVLPPLIIYDQYGQYCPEIVRMYDLSDGGKRSE